MSGVFYHTGIINVKFWSGLIDSSRYTFKFKMIFHNNVFLSIAFSVASSQLWLLY